MINLYGIDISRYPGKDGYQQRRTAQRELARGYLCAAARCRDHVFRCFDRITTVLMGKDVVEHKLGWLHGRHCCIRN